MLLPKVENSMFHWELGVFEGNKGKRGGVSMLPPRQSSSFCCCMITNSQRVLLKFEHAVHICGPDQINLIF